MNVTHTITGGLVHLSGNPIQIKLIGTPAGKLNYKLALKVICSTLMGSPFVEEIAPNSVSFQSVFNISGFVDQPAVYSFDYPTIGAVSPHDLLAFNIELEIGEIWTDENGDRLESFFTPDSNNKIRVLKGQLRPYDLALLNDSGKSFASEYINGGKFLTHLPNNQRVSPTQIPMLWYLSRWPELHPITLHLKINTADKVFHEPITQEHIIYDITGLVEFAFQPAFWGFVTNENTQIESYEFWITDAMGDVSEHRTFLVDHTYHENSFLFYYVNTLSGIDPLWLTGPYSEGLTTESEIAYREVPVLAGTKVASQTVVSSGSQRTWELNTGPKSRLEILALRDFLTSKQCWMVNPDNTQKLIPVIIESTDHQLFDSTEDIPNLTVKIREAHK